ncbi:TetR/AcrR family transcriptional regulator [Sphaerisporangium sp. TRM90804]|uniref:TetR/AcrR family transcriptional regulator n=1 Tax=Sphaerisporangium sp. TRM90804 TaxID=3031113 RepID=UPI00244B78F5|nr:TetR/AcrR family transcriptional regulator [Sphaerisporangium sp. TRM90804]MDH2430611.1 TetR/AcrR family transcriptional regulator [Sphaerisporangium sp. TRM90804]
MSADAGKAASRHRGNRHGRSEEARQSVLEAVDDLLVEVGYARLTIEGIAGRAGVAKQTIYRWWSSKNDILMDAFVQDAAEALIPADTADLRRDLCAHAREIAHFLSESDAGAVFRALTAQAQHDPELAARLRFEHLSKQRGYDRLPFERAIARGALDPGFDVDLAVDQIVGPIYYRVLVTGQNPSPEFTDTLVDAVLSRHIGAERL